MSPAAQPESPQHTAHDDARSELALEREKIQIERERLALERERWAAERDRLRSDQHLVDRSAGRVRMAISTLTLALLVALLAGGSIGAWIVSTRNRAGNDAMAQSLIQAISGDTNSILHSASSPLNRAGRRGGYLLILD